MTRRHLIAVLAPAGLAITVSFDMFPTREAVVLAAQDQAPSRRETTLTAADFRFTPDRIEVVQDDLVRITVRSGDIAHSFNIDEYRIAKRVAAGGTTIVELRADRVGTFPFYCNLTSEPGHDQMRGQLVVRPK